MVEDVEKLNAKLRMDSLRDGKILFSRDIRVEEGGAGERITSYGANRAG